MHTNTTTATRKQLGLEIAATANVVRKGKSWLVPSQSGKGRYTIRLHLKKPHCTCPDHETSGLRCKHIIAADLVRRRVSRNKLAASVAREVTEPGTARQVYGQDWRAYNASQTTEKDQFQELLHDLCSGLAEPVRPKIGRPRLPIHDAIFAACFKIYSTVSGRRFISDLRAAHEKGYISKVPHFNSIFNYLDNSDVTPILRELITETSLPLKSIEQDFACDSSGFTTSRFHRWFDHKYGAVRQEHEWVKVHLMCGVKTHIVTAVEIKDKDASDTKQLPALVDATAKNFQLNEVSGDKGYGSIKNYKAIQRHGATPYIAFKSIHTGRAEGLWQRMYHLYHFHRAEFLQHYHKRSNVESTFSMIKAKFRDHVRSKTDVAMVNEVLCKIICHNICCLIQESHELGIDTAFWSDSLH